MKTKLYFMITLLMFWVLSTLPNSFAQEVLSEPVVRLVYFLPKDRSARPERITAFQQLIKDAQEFFAEQMESHGFDRKTFRIETDNRGTPVVHRVDGKFNENYYYTRLSDDKIWEEFYEYFDELEHIYLIAIDLSQETLNDGTSCGLGGLGFIPMGGHSKLFAGKIAFRHRDETSGEEALGGSAIMPASGHCFYDTRGFFHPLRLINHELGHAFGLDHDFRDPDAVVGGRGYQLSKCAAEWLSVHRFFNPTPIDTNQSGSVSLLGLQASGQNEIHLRFQVSDPNGLHQAQLLVPEDGSWGPLMLIECQELDGQTQTIEFVTTELTDRVVLQFMDDLGNITWATFLTDIASLLPPPKVVSIPDRNLATAIRETLELGRNDRITDRQMLKLRQLYADEKQIKNLTGLESATNLKELGLGKNPAIKSYASLAQLPKLRTLYLWGNGISTLSVLPPLPQLEFLDLNWNQIADIRRLADFTKLKTLWIQGNNIRDIKPLAGLTHLSDLRLGENKISDVRSLAELVNLQTLHLQGNPIQDTSVLRKERYVDLEIPVTVPTTGTDLAIDKPPELTRDNFTIGPGEFAILVHDGHQAILKQAHFKTYDAYRGLGNNSRDIPNLSQFFQDGGRIELVSLSYDHAQFGDIVISEIMWGLDDTSPAKQYIELYNASAHTYTFAEANLSLRFSTASQESLPDGSFPPPHNPDVRLKVLDRVNNKGWKVPGKSGNLSENEPLISMYRTIDYTIGDVPDGTLASSWKASTGRVNLLAPSFGTPGAKHLPPAPVVAVEASQRPPMYWVDAKVGTLHRLVNDKVENILPNVQNATSLAVDVAGGKLYWTEKTGDRTGRIGGANLDGTHVKLVKNLTSVPHGIALDSVNGKIYLTNAWGKVQRLDIDGSNFQPNFITNLNAPKYITVDVADGKIYWTEGGERIRRANLDGSSVQKVATGLAEPTSLAVAGGKIYWTERTTENAGKLQRANLDGTNSEVLQTLPIAPTGIGVDPARNSLYLTRPSGEIHRRNLDGSGDQSVVTNLGSPSNIVLGISATDPVPTDTPTPPAEPVVDTVADVNQDKKVNKTDLLLVVTALGESPPANPNFDVNADGTVDIADVLLVIEALDDPVAAAAPSFGETRTALDPGRLARQIDILRAESDGSLKYEHAIAFFQSLLASIRPTQTQLLANYPNPFNPETWIPYQLAKPSDVSISIYAADGRLVRRLELGHQPVGIYESRSRAAYWDGRNTVGEPVASGLYFYTLTAGDFTATRKLLIAK